jgi:hypothetical protein
MCNHNISSIETATCSPNSGNNSVLRFTETQVFQDGVLYADIIERNGDRYTVKMISKNKFLNGVVRDIIVHSSPQKYPLLSSLTEDQAGHMIWRGDRYTGFGLIQITRLVSGHRGDMPINEAFEKLDMTPHQAKWHATAVLKYDRLTFKPVNPLR